MKVVDSNRKRDGMGKQKKGVKEIRLKKVREMRETRSRECPKGTYSENLRNNVQLFVDAID